MKLSVIIPVYNAETTLVKAIDSVINQTIGFENIELILIDDNSTDKSKDIITKYANEYDNINPIFLKENTGSPSEPRNIGIDNVTTDYLMFLDNDDELVSDLCETVYNIINFGGIDIVNTNYCKKFISGYYAFNDSSKEKILVKDPFSLRFTMWGNLFKTEFIRNNNIRCPHSLYEDGVFAVMAFTRADRIIQMPNYIGYIYTVEKEKDGSITHNIRSEVILDFIKGFSISNDYLTRNNYDKQRLIDDLPMILFMFFKFRGKTNDKIKLLRKINELENSFNYPIKLKSKPLNILNLLILSERYFLFIFLSKFIVFLYNNNNIKNFIFKKYSNVKKINI